MDPIRKVIPSEEGETIKRNFRQIEAESNHQQLTKRARADTKSLISEPGEPSITYIPEPRPEERTADYDQARLKNGLRYIVNVNKRNITPRTHEFLEIWKDAYKAALTVETPTETIKTTVKTLDNVYFSKSFYFRDRTDEEAKLLQAYVNLRQLELLANYGDYAGRYLQTFRSELKEAAKGQSEYSDTFKARHALGPQKTWAQIGNELDGKTPEELLGHVQHACLLLGYDEDHMKWLIKTWAERNNKFHNKIREYIEECDWNPLAIQLARDLAELPNIVPDRETSANWEKVLIKIRDDYFVVSGDEDNELNPRTWFANLFAQGLTKEKFNKNVSGRK